MIRVSIRASSSLAHAGIEQILEAEPDILVEKARQPEGTAPGDGDQCDVILWEGDPGGSGDWEDWSGSAGIGPPVIVLSDNAPADWIARALQAGVSSVLPKSVSGEELAAAVRAVATGLVVLHADGALAVAGAMPVRRPDPVEQLTAREREVLVAMAEGLQNKGIAARLNISEHTAKFHVASIMGKLGAASRTEAVTLAIKLGLLMV